MNFDVHHGCQFTERFNNRIFFFYYLFLSLLKRLYLFWRDNFYIVFVC